MRICLISREYPPDTGWGGIGAYTYQHARALRQLGHQVEVIALAHKDATSQPAAIDDGGVVVHRAIWSGLLQELSTIWISLPYSHYVLKCSLALWKKFLEVNSTQRFDVVEAPEHLAEALFPALTQVCPLVLRLHTPHSKFIRERYHNLSPSFDQELVSILERVPMLEATLLSSPSEDLARYAAFDTGIDLQKICIVCNPVDTEKFSPAGRQAIAPDGRLTVFFAGRLEERKGIAHLIDAVPLVLEQRKNVRFIVVGADTDTGPGKTSVLAALKGKLASNGCANAVQFVSHVPLAEMADHYRSADICVVPSLYENAPYTVLEAMACGKPVIGTSAGGTPEYVLDGETGIVVPPADSAALATAILELVEHPEKRQRLAGNARLRAVAEFDRLVIARQAVGTYELAIQTYDQKALYRRPADSSIGDFVSLVHAYHRNLCDLIYVHSLEFRLKYWLQQLRRRPKLTIARAALSTARTLGLHLASSSRLESLDAGIRASLHHQERLELEALLMQFKTEPRNAKAEPANPATRASTGTR